MAEEKQVYIIRCDHYQVPVKVGDNFVWATSRAGFLQNKGWKENDRPDLFIALDTIWLNTFTSFVSSGVPELEQKSLIPFVAIDWTDSLGAPEELLEQLVPIILQYVEKKKIVEMGCIGAHGRTGTLLACLIGKEESLPPKSAIEETRKRYCKQAIESKSQIIQVYEFLGSTEEQAELDFPDSFIEYVYKIVDGTWQAVKDKIDKYQAGTKYESWDY